MTWRRPAVAHDGGGDLALGGAQRVGQLADAQEGELDRPLAPVMLDGAREAVEVGQAAFQLGRLDLQQPLHRQRIKFPLPGQQLLPDQVGFVLGSEFAAFQCRLLRHFHRQVFLENARRAGQDIAFGDGGMRAAVPRLRESTSPLVTRTMHLPQVPSPPQGDSISTPACRAASSSPVCGGTSDGLFRRDGIQPWAWQGQI